MSRGSAVRKKQNPLLPPQSPRPIHGSRRLHHHRIGTRLLRSGHQIQRPSGSSVLVGVQLLAGLISLLDLFGCFVFHHWLVEHCVFRRHVSASGANWLATSRGTIPAAERLPPLINANFYDFTNGLRVWVSCPAHGCADNYVINDLRHVLSSCLTKPRRNVHHSNQKSSEIEDVAVVASTCPVLRANPPNIQDLLVISSGSLYPHLYERV